MRRDVRCPLRGLAVRILPFLAVLAAIPASAEESYGDLLAKGARYARARNHARALEAFGAAVRADPTGIDAYFNAGSVAERLRKCPETVLYFRGFLFLSPGTDDDRQAKAAIAACEGRPGMGTLTVRGEPKGAEVSLDGILQARMPAAALKVPAGVYRMRVSCSCPDYEDATREVTVAGGRDTEVEVALERKVTYGFLQIETEPRDGVTVYLDGERLGETPVEKQRLDTRKHSIRLEKAGHDPWVRNVVIERDKVKVVHADLEASVPAGEPAPARPAGQE